LLVIISKLYWIRS